MPVFVCPFCNNAAESLLLHLEHRRMHTVRHANQFYCGYDGCKYKFNCESSLRSHLIRKHDYLVSGERRNTLQAVVQDEGGRLMCTVSLCGKEFGKYAELSKHLAVHIHSGTAVKCPVPDCEKVYRVVSSLRSHMSKNHRVVIPFDQPSVEDNHVPQELDGVVPLTLIKEPECLRSIFLSNLSYLFLEMETKLMIPSSSIQKVAAQLFNIHEIHLNHVKHMLSDFLISKSDPALTKEALDVLSDNDLFLENKSSLSTSYKRHKFYKTNLDYIQPEKVHFEKNKSKFFHYVSIKESIKSVIKSTSDLATVMPDQDPFILRDICDGTNMKKDPFFCKQNVLKAVVFEDAFEVATRARKKHKLLGIYFSIANLPLHLRSQLDYIFLIALCKEVDFNADRDAVHQKVVNELLELETHGVTLESGEVVFGSCCCVCGDNLGSHALACMVENFSKSHFFCRYCLINRHDFVKDGGIIKFYDRRTVDSYNECARDALNNDVDSVKGVKGNSIYNQLSHFHVCNRGLPPCFAHDLFEGIVSVDLALFLRHFVEKEQWFSYKKLEGLMTRFPYTTEDQRDRPELIKSKPKKLDGKACQIWTFVRLLPLIILEKLKDKEDDVWINFLRLQEIVDIISSPEIHVSVLPYLQLLISDYIHCRMESFPQCPLKPKHHYLSHYPELISEFGPLINVWTLRFESKHGFFKSALTAGKNFKNVTKSASEKHQLYQAYMLSSRKDAGHISMSGEVEFHSAMYMEEIRVELNKGGVSSSGFFDCASVVFKGTSYSKGNILAFEQKENEHSLKLGYIRIVISDGCEQLFFLVQCVDACYDAGLRAYKLGVYSGYRCVNVSNLVHRQPVREYRLSGRIYSKLKHAIVCNPLA